MRDGNYGVGGDAGETRAVGMVCWFCPGGVKLVKLGRDA